jgi:hypothetical protein
MPIDLRRFIVDDDKLWSILEASLCERNVEQAAEMVENLRQCNHSTRLAAQQVETYRSKLNKKQAVDKNQLKELENVYQAQYNALTELLSHIPNFLDFDIHKIIKEYEPSHEEERSEGNLSSDFEQLMFCIGGYEDVGKLSVLTARGRHMIHALEQFLLDSCRYMGDLQSSETYEVPLMLSIPMDVYKRRGSMTQQSTVDDESIVGPSWIYLIEHQLATGATYFDKSLPQSHLLLCHKDISLPPSTTCTNNKNQPALFWYENLAIQHYIQVILVTGPSLEVDSRPLQLAWMEHVQTMYTQLAPSAQLILRSIPSDQLLPTEASRIVLEGYLSHSNSNKNNTKTTVVELASLSNLLDYPSTGMKHGNSLDKQCVHVLQGKVGLVGEVLEWVLQHCPLDDNDDQTGVALPSCLDLQDDSKINFCRRIIQKKGGRRFVQPIITASSPPETPRDIKPKVVNQQRDEEISTRITAHDIQLEAATCPFTFLPFYQN